MRRFPSVPSLAIFLAVLLLIGLAGCGGSKSSSPATAAHVTVTPAVISLGFGDTLQLGASATAANGNPVFVTVTFASSNLSVLQISPSGVACAGFWDTSFVNCTPATSTGTSNVTATTGTVTSAPVVAYVHPRVDGIVITPPQPFPACTSQGKTLQLTATAFSAGTPLTLAQVGPFLWTVVSPAVATVDNSTTVTNGSTTNGTFTAAVPGQTSVTASLNNVTSPPVTFITCPIVSINAHEKGNNSNTTGFPGLATGTAKTIEATLTDSSGATITNVTLGFISNNSVSVTAAPVAGSTTAAPTATITAVAPGFAEILTTCAPPQCNVNLTPIYGNLMSASVNGTSSTTVYVTSTDSTTVVPVTTSNNTPGTAITLPDTPNSIMIDPVGAHVYLGSASQLMIITTSNNTEASNTNIKGKVLAISPNGAKVIVSDTVGGNLYVADASSGAIQKFPFGDAIRAAWAPDNTKAYIVGTMHDYVYQPSGSFLILPFAGAANDVTIAESGYFGYIAQPGAIAVRETCDNAQVKTLAAGNPTLITSTPDATRIVAADSPNFDVVTTATSGSGGCSPATVPGNNDTIATVPAPSAFTATAAQLNALIPSPDSAHVYLTSDQPSVFDYNVAAGTVTAIPLTGTGVTAFTGGLTLDATTLYVGASDQKVHVITTPTGSDSFQIPVTLTCAAMTPCLPNLVAVRPQ